MMPVSLSSNEDADAFPALDEVGVDVDMKESCRMSSLPVHPLAQRAVSIDSSQLIEKIADASSCDPPKYSIGNKINKVHLDPKNCWQYILNTIAYTCACFCF
jgi:hypothetical protein